MARAAGSLARGRRSLDEVPPVPSAAELNPRQVAAQAVLIELVQDSGGRIDAATPIALGGVDVLADLLDSWGRSHARVRQGQLYYNGRPGLWHAFDALYPLQDPNRWDRLRQAAIIELEARGWRRAVPPRGAGFYLPS